MPAYIATIICIETVLPVFKAWNSCVSTVRRIDKVNESNHHNKGNEVIKGRVAYYLHFAFDSVLAEGNWCRTLHLML